MLRPNSWVVTKEARWGHTPPNDTRLKNTDRQRAGLRKGPIT